MMPRVVAATLINPASMEAASWEDQERLAKPGSYQVLEVQYTAQELLEVPGLRARQLELDVNCPGCGRVWHLRPPQYNFKRAQQEDLTIGEPVHFAACCDWTGSCTNGQWVPG